jgi:hypothetical protein
VSEATYSGVVWAWKADDRWLYADNRTAAPDGAMKAELFMLDGQTILHVSSAQAGEFVHAIRADSA